jgi:choline monooxygenase
MHMQNGSNTISAKLGIQPQLTATQRPLAEASVLPPACYTSSEWLDLEVQTIFMREWICIGRQETIPKAGDYFTISVGNEPVAAVRGKDGIVRAFSNVCRHRASPVLTARSGNVKTLCCPYHCWTYSLDGRLFSTPGYPPPMEHVKDFNREEYGLFQLRLEAWAGFLFVNFDRDAPPLAEWLGDFPEFMKNYRFEEMIFQHSLRYDVECNWKVYLENSMESYHSPYLHRKHVDPARPALWTFENSRGPYEAMYSTGSVVSFSGLPTIPGLSEKEQRGMYHVWVHPNLQIVATPTYMAYRHYFPKGPDKFEIIFNWCFPPEAIKAAPFSEVAQKYYAKSEEILLEDMEICPRIQQGLHSAFYRPGRYSTQEYIVHKIANYVLQRAGRANGGATATSPDPA